MNRKHRPAPYVWDDMYSFYKIMLEFKDQNLEGFDEKLSEIKDRILTQEVHFLFNKFPLKVYLKFSFFAFYRLLGLVQKIVYKIKRKNKKRSLKRQLKDKQTAFYNFTLK